ncbi:MAG: manganese efflux pump [Clostridiales bacterium]|jgi:putative Mn2+ efflux pump MntP|nr:manganese efflux pump [Clostridiales bacterium]
MVAVFFAITLSIDALGVGISCALRDRRPNFFTYAIIFVVSLVVMGAAVLFGNMLAGFFAPETAGLVGAVWIMLLGAWIFVGAIKKKDDAQKSQGKITIVQSLSFALVLSVDSMGAGLAAAALGLSIAFLPLMAATFQVLFFSLGVLAAELLPLKKKGTKLPTMMSGIILVAIGIIGLV